MAAIGAANGRPPAESRLSESPFWRIACAQEACILWTNAAAGGRTEDKPFTFH
jgi:hypothetical protein